MAEYVRIKIRRDTSDNFASKNPVLQLGEIAADMTKHSLKVGNGTNDWSSLPWINGDMDASLEQVLRMLSGITSGSLLDAVDNISDLNSKYPNPMTGDTAYVRNANAFYY